jgi:YidC/Oxa1 family membrane protein insertase
MAKRAQRRGFAIVEDAPAEIEEPKTTQRVQPVNPKNRKKKTGGKK